MLCKGATLLHNNLYEIIASQIMVVSIISHIWLLYQSLTSQMYLKSSSVCTDFSHFLIEKYDSETMHVKEHPIYTTTPVYFLLTKHTAQLHIIIKNIIAINPTLILLTIPKQNTYSRCGVHPSKLFSNLTLHIQYTIFIP